MTTFDTGRQAEEAVADYLARRGFTVMEQNWRTRFCEIDVVASKDNRIYFVEVKYRVSSSQGNGLDYITPKKQQQMAFAAESWVSSNKWRGEYCLAGAAVTGLEYHVTDFIEL